MTAVNNITTAMSLYPELFESLVRHVQHYQHGHLPHAPFPLDPDNAWTDADIVATIARINQDYVYFSDQQEFLRFLTTLHHLIFLPLAIYAGVLLLWALVGGFLPVWGRTKLCPSFCAWGRRQLARHEADYPQQERGATHVYGALPRAPPPPREGEGEGDGAAWGHAEIFGRRRHRSWDPASTSCAHLLLYFGVVLTGILLGVTLVLCGPWLSREIFPGVARDTTLLVFMLALEAVLLGGTLVISWTMAGFQWSGWQHARDRDGPESPAELLWRALGYLSSGGQVPCKRVEWRAASEEQWPCQRPVEVLDTALALSAFPYPVLDAAQRSGVDLVFDFDSYRVRWGIWCTRVVQTTASATLAIAGMATAAWMVFYPHQTSPYSSANRNLTFHLFFLSAFSQGLMGFLGVTCALLPTPISAPWAYFTYQVPEHSEGQGSAAPGGRWPLLRDIRVPLQTSLGVVQEYTLQLVALVALFEALQFPSASTRTVRTVGALLVFASRYSHRALWGLLTPCMHGDQRAEHLDHAEQLLPGWEALAAGGTPGGLRVPAAVAGSAACAGEQWPEWLLAEGQGPPPKEDLCALPVSELLRRALRSVRLRLVAPRLFLQLNAEDRHLRFFIDAVASAILLAGAALLAVSPRQEAGGWLHQNSGAAWYTWVINPLIVATLVALTCAGLSFFYTVYHLTVLTHLPASHSGPGAQTEPGLAPPPRPAVRAAVCAPVRASVRQRGVDADYRASQTYQTFSATSYDKPFLDSHPPATQYSSFDSPAEPQPTPSEACVFSANQYMSL